MLRKGVNPSKSRPSKMQAIILAAGKSTRTYPLTLTRPKTLLKTANKTIIEHNLESMADFVEEVIIVVGYKKEMIMDFLGNKFRKIRIKYVVQKEQLGTSHALLMAEKLIKGRFLLMNGDDVFPKNGIRECVKKRNAILTAKVKNPENFGVIVAKNGIIADFVEKPKEFVSDLVNAGLYVLDENIFSCIRNTKISERGELELPDAIKLLSKSEKIHCIKTRDWLPIGYPWDLLYADLKLRKWKNSIGKNSKITGKAVNSSVGNDCTIKGTVKDSIIMDNSIVEKDSIVEHSVIGENVHFSGTAKSGKNIELSVNGKSIRVPVIGAIIGDNCKIRNVEIKQGCRINPGKIIADKKIERDVK